MIRVIIADDEESTVELVQDILLSSGLVEVVGIASDGLECLRLFEQLKPDALFLDIKMAELSGIEVAQNVMQTDEPPLVAFITNYDDFALRAFELKAIDYVIKISDLKTFTQRLLETVHRMENALQQREPVLLEMREMIAQLARQNLHPLQRKIPVRDQVEGTVRLLDPQDVICIVRQERRAMLITSGKVFPTYATIDQLSERLSSQGFFRANPGALINIQYIEHLIPNGDGSYDVLLQNGQGQGQTLHQPITVSRSRAKELFKVIQMP